MKITKKEWLLFFVLALFSFLIWYRLGYSEFAFVDLSVDRNAAVRQADSYLVALGINPKNYIRASVFLSDDWSDRYLQKTVGMKSEEEFIKRHGFEMFSWQVRYFRELSKEEYLVAISSKTGKVIGFRHLIEDIEARRLSDKESALKKAADFIAKTCGINLADYEFHDESVRRYENRVDYSFTWEKKGVYVPWGKNEGGAKLLVGATVSGDEVREFFTSLFDIPEKFRRYIDKQSAFGEYLSTFSFIGVLMFLVWSIYIVVKRQHTTVIRYCKKWYLELGAFFIVINIFSVFNNFQSVLVSCPTSVYLASFLGIYLVKVSLNLLYFSVDFIIPGLAGESLRQENYPGKNYSSFLHYLRAGWFNRGVSASIILGYLLFLIMLGFQSAIFYFGQRYLGVWKEWILLKQLSSAYLPFLGAFILAAGASIAEEIMYRFFGINWGRKYLKNTFLAVLVSSLIWGIAHARYAIFPVWFRGIEVTFLGILLGFMFLKYGIIAVITAHYLFDAFWGTAAHILGKSPGYLFLGSLAVLILPLGFALLTYLKNNSEKESEIKTIFNATQAYNLGILTNFVALKKSQGYTPQAIKAELIHHNWDIALINLALESVFKERENV